MTMTQPTTPNVTAPPSHASALRAECGRIVRHLEMLVRQERNGPLAELRRLGRATGGPPPEAFWTLIERAGVASNREQFWEALLPMMVTCPHRRGALAGRVLRDAGVAPSRIERWLRLSAADAPVELRKLVRRVDAVDWVDLSALLDRWEHPQLGDERRRAFARAFFLHRPAAAAPSLSPPTPSAA